jgi:hypothetical protein
MIINIILLKSNSNYNHCLPIGALKHTYTHTHKYTTITPVMAITPHMLLVGRQNGRSKLDNHFTGCYTGKSVFAICMSYLLMPNKPHIFVHLKRCTLSFSHSFCGTSIWGQLRWIFCLRSQRLQSSY